MNIIKKAAVALFLMLLLVPVAEGCTKNAIVKDNGGTSVPAVSTTAVSLPDISMAKVGLTVGFGRYEQDNNEANGKEPIAWNVLAVKDGKALLISKMNLDFYEYADTGKPYSWKISGLRHLLNDSFFNAAFSESEQKAVVLTQTDKAVTDRVFCLSTDEAKTYFTGDAARLAQNTAFATAMGAGDFEGRACWWLRSSYTANDTLPAGVADDGKIYPGGQGGMIGGATGVRPAVWVNLGGNS